MTYKIVYGVYGVTEITDIETIEEVRKIVTKLKGKGYRDIKVWKEITIA